MQNNEGNDENVFVIEVCQNCKDHHWNTRHDQAKYQEYFNRGKLFAVRWLRRISHGLESASTHLPANSFFGRG